MTEVAALAEFLAKTSFSDLPSAAIDHAKMIVSSTIASAAAGAGLPSVAIVRELGHERGGNPESTVWFDGGFKLAVPDAARVNVISSEAAASDDSHLRMGGHPGTTLCAVAIAMSEFSPVGGEELLCSIVAGYEAFGRFGQAMISAFEDRGFHATVLNSIGGAVAAAKILGATPEQMVSAIGLAATTVGGVAQATSSWAREFRAGGAALSACNAAFVASRGYWAHEGIIAGRRGFLEAFNGTATGEGELSRDLGTEWDITSQLAIKLRPAGYPYVAAIEAAITAATRGDLRPNAVEKIMVSGPGFTRHQTLIGQPHPTNLADALHSLAYYMGAAVVDRRFGWEHATPEKFMDPEIGRLQDLVEFDPAPAGGFDGYEFDRGATVTIHTKDGVEWSELVNQPPGSATQGIAWTDVDEKLRTLTKERLTNESIDELVSQVHRFETLPDIATLTALLGGHERDR